MNRWTVFDSPTANAADQPDRNVELEPAGSVANALDEAVQSNRPVVLVLPAGNDRVTVARITSPERKNS